MATLHIEHGITDYASWRTAYDTFADARQFRGVRSERVQQPVDDDAYIVVDLTFDTIDAATAFQHFLETEVWSAAATSSGLRGTPRAVVLEKAPRPEESQVSEEVTLINLFEVPEGRDAAFLDLWKMVNHYMCQKPGYLAHRLHQAKADSRYRYINVARWVNGQTFAAAHDQGFRDLIQRPEWSEFVSTPSLYGVLYDGVC